MGHPAGQSSSGNGPGGGPARYRKKTLWGESPLAPPPADSVLDAFLLKVKEETWVALLNADTPDALLQVRGEARVISRLHTMFSQFKAEWDKKGRITVDGAQS